MRQSRSYFAACALFRVAAVIRAARLKRDGRQGEVLRILSHYYLAKRDNTFDDQIARFVDDQASLLDGDVCRGRYPTPI